MKKKAISIVITIFLIASMVLGAPGLEVHASSYNGKANGKDLRTILNSISGYCIKSGSYKCTASVGKGTHYCCYNFAAIAYKKIWGVAFSKTASNNYLNSVAAGDRTLTVANLKKYLSNAAPGAMIRIDNSSKLSDADSNGHSMIFCGMNSLGDGAYFLQANYDGKGTKQLSEIKFSSLLSGYYGRYKYIKYIIWPNAGLTKYEASTLHISGNTQVGSIPEGREWNCNGTVSSNYNLIYVNGYILKKTGKSDVWKEDRVIVAYVDNVNNKSFNIANSNINTQLAFSILPKGEYYYIITAKDEAGGLINEIQSFTVECNHNDIYWIVSEEATCQKAGYKNGYCKKCWNLLYVDPIPILEHEWDSGTITKASTCINEGIKTYKCKVCGTTKTEDIPATGVHTWDSGKIVTQPTTTATGVKKYICTKCGATKNETIAKLIETKKAGVSYTTHIQSIGWQGVVRNGDLAGTVGDSKRLEAIKINLENAPYSGNIEYRTHVQTYGWQGWVKNGALSGTSGQAKRLEAIQIRLTGEMAKHYDVYYRIQVQSFGWLGWAKNGEYSGSAGHAKRLEAIQIVLVEKGKSIDRSVLNKQAKITSSTKVTNSTPYVAKAPSIHYQTHVQSIGWQGLKRNGEVSGVIGQSKRLEAIKIDLSKPPYEGGIRYKTHIQSIGWQGWKYDGDLSGTSGQAKRLEAICIELTGEMAKHYDVYYRVHAQSYGWLGWAKNGQNAGTAGYAKRLEGIQIVLVEKGQQGPGAKYQGIMADRTEAYISK